MQNRENCQVYEQPAVVYESELEVRAGSPVGIPNPLDFLGESK